MGTRWRWPGVPIGVRVGDGVELVQARRLRGGGVDPDRGHRGWGWLSLRGRPEKGGGGMSRMRVFCPLSGVQLVSSGGEPVIEVQLMTTDARS